MKMRRFIHHHLVFGSLIFLLMVIAHPGAGAALAAGRYAVTGLGDLYGGSFGSWAYGMNESTQVTGHSSGSIGQAFIWEETTGIIGLGTLPNTPQSFGKAINESGQVAGHTVNPARAFIWEDGSGLTELNSAVESRAADINGIAQIVGFYYGADGTAAFVWDAPGGMRDIGSLPGGINGSWANGINDSGQVTGCSYYASVPDPVPPGGSIELQQAFLWQDGAPMTGLGFLPDDNTSCGNDVNDVGAVAGYSRGDDGAHQAVTWHNGAITSLGAPAGGGNWSQATALNNAGQVVGTIQPVGDSQTSFVWDNAGGMALLESLLDGSGAGWKLTAVSDINDKGEIVGYGTSPSGDYEAFLLTPVPCASREKGKTCRDGVDNDCDGATDGDDPDCGDDGGASEGKGKTCSDGTDNDLDGLVDCADPDCGKNRACR